MHNKCRLLVTLEPQLARNKSEVCTQGKYLTHVSEQPQIGTLRDAGGCHRRFPAPENINLHYHPCQSRSVSVAEAEPLCSHDGSHTRCARGTTHYSKPHCGPRPFSGSSVDARAVNRVPKSTTHIPYVAIYSRRAVLLPAPSPVRFARFNFSQLPSQYEFVPTEVFSPLAPIVLCMESGFLSPAG